MNNIFLMFEINDNEDITIRYNNAGNKPCIVRYHNTDFMSYSGQVTVFHFAINTTINLLVCAQF
jgi:hypothetical protein